MDDLSQKQAFALLVIYCITYVAPLHMSAATRASPRRSRDDPAVIRARIRTVSISTTLCSVMTFILIHSLRSGPVLETLHLMGYWPLDPKPVAKATALTALLFAAPLYESFLIDGGYKDWASFRPLKEVWQEWPSWRNLVAGPITEECLFRSAAVPLLLVAGTTLTNTILLSPLVFGLAHAHHFYEFRITNPEVSVPTALARSVLQFSYTSLFGIYATFLFLRTGSLGAVIAVHTFCNCMGLPRVWGKVQPWWMTMKEIESPSALHWTVIHYVLLFSGAVAWYQALLPLTETSSQLAAM